MCLTGSFQLRDRHGAFRYIGVVFPENYDKTNDDWKLIKLWNAMKPYMLDGDYCFPADDSKVDPEHWSTYQFHAPFPGCGAVQFLRNEFAEQNALAVKLHGLNTEAQYVFTD